MKHVLFLHLPLLILLASCGKTEPAPAPAAPAATYAEGAGAAQPLALPRVSFQSVANGPRAEPRRAIFVSPTLPNGTSYEFFYSFQASDFPPVGPVTLDYSVGIAPLTATGPGTYNQDPASTATLRVESVMPRVVSGTYTGKLTNGGPVVRFTFARLPL